MLSDWSLMATHCRSVQLGQMHLTLGIAFQSASADACNLEKAQQHLHKAKKIWEAHAPKVSSAPTLNPEP